MYKLILLPLALDQGHGHRAIALAERLKAEDGKIMAVHVIDRVPNYSNYYISSTNEEEILSATKKAMAERIGDNKEIEAVVLYGHPGRTVTDYADKIGADCIIAGSHKPDLTDFFLGSTAARIMRYAKCSVHVIRPDQPSTSEK